MKVTIWTRSGMAYFFAEGKVENRCSVRFLMEDGSHQTIWNDDIISIEDDGIEEEPEQTETGKYRIGESDLNGLVWIEDMENGKVFNGYDFMGSVNWEDYGGDAYWCEPEEAMMIISDLVAADM